MNDAAIPALIKAAGIDALRYPGGSYSDIYNWQTNTAAGRLRRAEHRASPTS